MRMSSPTTSLLLLVILQWMLGSSFFHGVAGHEDAWEYGDEDGQIKIGFARDQWAERQADLEEKWGFEVRLFSFVSFLLY